MEPRAHQVQRIRTVRQFLQYEEAEGVRESRHFRASRGRVVIGPVSQRVYPEAEAGIRPAGLIFSPYEGIVDHPFPWRIGRSLQRLGEVEHLEDRLADYEGE